ncbi:hypothetical protein Q4F19_10205 [Sphingomonas sp. BIUV-7]|uniref:WYL domain-containing protein n=1 Tax=Sphingomonas natans TaxID=3063330 RepID=A0ABT8YAS0_9SPHN|nr:hypothetical protein [Sphingomonas sp. BIUV-7]MDO6414750.1 hypothetical protein [Sphingomonas sp. BIUV-7]
MSQNALVLQAIALKQCVEATYNRVKVRLAPHILYTRHDELYVDAVTIERDGQPPKEIKIGTFKLAGLQDLAVANRAFVPQTIFDPGSEKYQGVTLFAVERS